MKLKFRKIHYFVQNHTARKWQSWDFNPNLLNSKPGLLPHSELPSTQGSCTSPNTQPTPEPPHNLESPLSAKDLFTPQLPKSTVNPSLSGYLQATPGPSPNLDWGVSYFRTAHILLEARASASSETQEQYLTASTGYRLCFYGQTARCRHHMQPGIPTWKGFPDFCTFSSWWPHRWFHFLESHYPMQSVFFSANENENTYPLGLS